MIRFLCQKRSSSNFLLPKITKNFSYSFIKPNYCIQKPFHSRHWHISDRISKQTNAKFVGTNFVTKTFISASTWNYWYGPVYCEANAGDQTVLINNIEQQSDHVVPPPPKRKLISKGDITFGSILGFCTGFLFKKIGKMVAIAVGIGFVFLQYMAYQGFVTIHWQRINNAFTQEMDVDQDGHVTARDTKSKLRILIDLLTVKFQFKSCFVSGFYLGLRYG